MLGQEDDPLVVRGIVCATLAGALVGRALGRFIAGSPRIVRSGALAGVAFHPLTWLVFVLVSWFAPYVRGDSARGSLVEAIYDALAWSVGSVAFGAVLTVPVFVFIAWTLTRVEP